MFMTLFFREKRFVAMKVVKSAEHYTETALDEIKLLRSVSLINITMTVFLQTPTPVIFTTVCVCVPGEEHRSQ